MVQDQRKACSIGANAEEFDYDPLADFDVDDDFDEMAGQGGPCTDSRGMAPFSVRSSEQPAEERIAELFAALAPRRRVLMGILEYLDEPRRSDALQNKVDELQAYDTSVYTGYDYSLLLHEAGAVKKTEEDGSPFDENAEQAPDIVEVNGSRFYKPTDGKQVFWTITDEGRAYLAADDPFGRLAKLISEDAKYREIYRDVLAACADENGRSIDDLAEIVDKNPLSRNPRKHCSYFTKKLEDCGALVWAKTWRTTECGKKGIDALFVETPADIEANAASSTEGM